LKTYRLPRNVVAQVKGLIATYKPSPRSPSALVRILKLLCESRNYEHAGIFLVVAGREVPRAFSGPQAAAGQLRPELSVRIKIASHTLGTLRVQLAPGHGFSPEERVLLHEVAEILALYLSGKGKYLVRKAREALRETTAANFGEPRGYQPASDKGGGLELRRAAAGDKSRS
jgi:hypothetical protein